MTTTSKVREQCTQCTDYIPPGQPIARNEYGAAYHPQCLSGSSAPARAASPAPSAPVAHIPSPDSPVFFELAAKVGLEEAERIWRDAATPAYERAYASAVAAERQRCIELCAGLHRGQSWQQVYDAINADADPMSASIADPIDMTAEAMDRIYGRLPGSAPGPLTDDPIDQVAAHLDRVYGPVGQRAQVA